MRALPVTLLVISACGLPLLGPEFEDRFTHFGGCADVLFFAVDARDEVMVTFSTQGLIAEAREAGAETTTVVTFPSDDVLLVIEQGARVSDATCDDVVENFGPRVERSWTAVAGTATVRIRPLAPSIGGRGDLVLEDIVFESDDAHEVTLDRLEWSDVAVGWLAG